MGKIENKVLSVSNEGLIKKLEEEWSILETLQKEIKKKIENYKNEKIDFEKIISQAEFLFTHPEEMRKKSNFEIRQLLFRVWFGGVLYYKKNQGYQTPETTGLFYLFSSLWATNSHVIRQGGTDTHCFKFSKTKLKSHINIIL